MKPKETHPTPGESAGRMQRSASPCPDAGHFEPLLYAYADGGCTEAEEEEVRTHLAGCPACRAALADIRWMLSCMRHDLPDPPPGFSASVMEAVRAEKTAAASSADSRDIPSAKEARIFTELPEAEKAPVRRVIGEASPAVVESVRTEKAGEKPRTFHAVRISSARRMIRILGGLAAALLLCLGAVRLLPYLTQNGGTGSRDALIEAQENTGVTDERQPQHPENGGESAFSDPGAPPAGPGSREPCLVTVSVAPGDAAALLRLLAETFPDLVESDGEGWRLPDSSYEGQIKDMLGRAGIACTVTRKESTEDGLVIVLRND